MANLKRFSFDFHRNLIALKKLMLEDAGRIMAREGSNHFEQSWDKGGFTDKVLVKWKPRTEPAKKFTKKGKPLKSFQAWMNKNQGRATLISHRGDTRGGHLKDSIRTSLRSNSVVFATDKPYAKVHNEGGKAGRGAGFRMKKRQFIGHSEQLDKKIIDKINREMDKIFNITS